MVEGVLELLGKILDDKARPLGLVKVQGLGVIAELNGVDPNEVDLALVLGCDRLDEVDVLFLLFVRRVNEQVRERLAALSVNLVVVGVDLVNDRDGEILDPALEVSGGERGDGVGVFGDGIIEGAVDDDSRRSDAGCFEDLFVGGQAEKVVVAVLARSRVELNSESVGGGADKSKSDKFVGLLELVEGLLRDATNSW